ncbi:MAG TPA: 4a-hydroxytetrahydrobiopterin dehydratase [Acidobacteriaceae bacterium]
MRKPLDEAQLTAAAATLPNWKLDNGELVRWATFADFNQAMTFVNRVASFAEGANHHPDIDIRYNRVRLALVTHDAGGITQMDIDLARSIEADLS